MQEIIEQLQKNAQNLEQAIKDANLFIKHAPEGTLNTSKQHRAIDYIQRISETENGPAKLKYLSKKNDLFTRQLRKKAHQQRKIYRKRVCIIGIDYKF